MIFVKPAGSGARTVQQHAGMQKYGSHNILLVGLPRQRTAKFHDEWL